MGRRTERKLQDADRYREGLKLYCSGRPREAVELLGTLRNDGDLAGRLGRYYEGLSHRSLGIEALQDGRFAEAEQQFKDAVRCLGRQADLTGYLCGIYARAGQFERCAIELDKSVDEDVESADWWRRLAQAQWQSGRREEALLTLERAIRHLGGQGVLLMQLGLFHAAEERFDQAAEYLARAACADCTRPETHYYLALASAGAGDFHQAVRSFQRAWELRPDDTAVALQLAIAARAAEQVGQPVVVRPPQNLQLPVADSHIRQLAAYVQSEPDFIDAFLALPPSEADEELFGLLAGVLQTALANHPDYADLQYRASGIMLRLGRLAPALAHARRAVEINPRYVHALVHLAEMCDRMGRQGEAVSYVELAIRYGADWPDVHCLAGDLLSGRGSTLQARKHFARAIEINADYPRANEALAALAA